MDSHLLRLQRELEQTIAGATPADLARGPAGKWTPAEILEHLYITYSNTNRGVRKCLEKGFPLATRATLRHRVATMLITRFGYVPSGFPAPERTRPQGMPAEQVLRDIFSELDRMDSGLADLENKFGSATKVMDHPLLGPLTAEQWRKFHLAHGRHHARQIRERLTRA